MTRFGQRCPGLAQALPLARLNKVMYEDMSQSYESVLGESRIHAVKSCGVVGRQRKDSEFICRSSKPAQSLKGLA